MSFLLKYSSLETLTFLIPESDACLSYYSERNFEYSWSISDYSESIVTLLAHGGRNSGDTPPEFTTFWNGNMENWKLVCIFCNA